MLWQAGGSILSPDGKQAGFNSAAGIKAMTLLQQLTTHHSIYLDNGSDNYLSVFNNGHIGMLWTGPWDLAQIVQSKVNYGVTILPGDQNHQTISGPDNWVMFNNGADARTGSVDVPEVAHLACHRPAVGDADRRPAGPGLGVQAPRLQEVTSPSTRASECGRPTSTTPRRRARRSPSTRRSRRAVGQAVQSVLLGKASPKHALNQAAQQVNGILAAPG